MSDLVSTRLTTSRKELLDLGLRNPLISLAQNRKKITIVDEKSSEIFRILTQERKAMTFAPLPQAALSDDGDEELLQTLNGDSADWESFFAEQGESSGGSDLAARHTDTVLQTRLAPDTLQVRLLRFHNDARTYMEEQGVNIMFLALGFLHWHEADHSDTHRRGPLLLLPVRLDRTSARERFKLRYTDEDIADNLSLHEKLITDFNVHLPVIGDIEDFDTDRFFTAVEKAVHSMPGWSVQKDEILLGFFSFGKFLMYRDLDEKVWPAETPPSQNELLGKLLGDEGFREPSCPIGDDDFIDPHLPVQDMDHVMDADGSQTLALMDAVRFGRNLVIQGPPGTGKSQTITNLIAAAIGADKTVLFVSEKMAALEVVKRRLDAIGLGDAALELHSNKTNKKAVISEIKRTMRLTRPVDMESDRDAESCARVREQLNAYAFAANTPIRNSGVSPVRAVGQMSAIGPEVLRLKTDFQIMKDWTQSDWASAHMAVEQLQSLLKTIGPPYRNPFRDTNIDSLMPHEITDASEALRTLIKSTTELEQAAVELSAAIGADCGKTTEQIRAASEKAINIARAVEIRAQYGDMLTTQAWDQTDWAELLRVYNSIGMKWWRIFSLTFRRAVATLKMLCVQPPPRDAQACIELMQGVLFCQANDPAPPKSRDSVKLKHTAEQSENAVKYWEQNRERVRCALGMPEAAMKNPKSPIHILSDDKSLEQQRKVLEAWVQNIDMLDEMAKFNVQKAKLDELGLESVASEAFSMSDAGDNLVRAFEATWYECLLRIAWDERPELRQFDRNSHETGIRQFCELDRTLIERNRARMALKHWDNMPRPGSGGGELGILSHEVEKTRRHLPIRRLMEKAGHAVQAVKPVFMMSPMSIASYLPPGALEFDLIVFDEASQVKPADALGALLRGRQAIVVGDTRQLPPTNFFETMAEIDQEEQESQTADLESVLSLFLAKNAPERMLRWHYRSLHESLIAVSNHEFYENRLMIFPSCGVDRMAPGLKFHYLPDTAYDRGRSRTNKDEALHVARAVMEHARTCPNLTLGVAAFSMSQRDAISLQLEMLRRKDPSCEDFFNRHELEPFFIKNLENVQGDERDVILISVGYGRTADGKMAMNFGPLNKPGGERRLNVLITRARRCCRVFCNFTADHIDLTRTQARGVAALKAFLSYSKDRVLPVSAPTGHEPDSLFEEQVLRVLEERGIPAVPQIGCGGYRIDIGIQDPDAPGRFILGVECDGASYHSVLSARDRDRLRQEVLESLGWRLHRIWSTEWFRNQKKEIERLEHAVRRALEQNVNTQKSPVPQIEQAQTIERTDTTLLDMPQNYASRPYQAAEIHPWDVPDFSYMSASPLADMIVSVVKVESPVHIYTIMTRIAWASDTRLTQRIRDILDHAAEKACEKGLVIRRGKFFWTPEMTKPPLRDRSAERLHDIRLIAPEEIEAAFVSALHTAFSMERDEAIKATALLFGFNRLTQKVRGDLELILDRCLHTGSIVAADNGRLSLP